jgi:hypothetical protein
LIDKEPSAEIDMKKFYHRWKAYEMPTTAESADIGEGKTFVAELEGSTVVLKSVEK